MWGGRKVYAISRRWGKKAVFRKLPAMDQKAEITELVGELVGGYTNVVVLCRRGGKRKNILGRGGGEKKKGVCGGWKEAIC